VVQVVLELTVKVEMQAEIVLALAEHFLQVAKLEQLDLQAKQLQQVR
jgi:hypothetical protein